MRVPGLDSAATMVVLLRAFVLLLLLPLSALAAEEPLKKIDRMKLVGPPVLDDTTAPGLYLWIEDGWFQLAAVTDLPFGTKKRRLKTYAITVSSTKPITEKLGGFKRAGGSETGFTAHVAVGAHPERGRFKTEGEVVISNVETEQGHSVPIFVGPLAKRAATSVRIGRF